MSRLPEEVDSDSAKNPTATLHSCVMIMQEPKGKRVKKVLLLAVVVALGSGCSLFFNPPEYSCEFINNSSYTVTVTPNGQTSWSTVLLTPGTNVTVIIPEEFIYYVYVDANLVIVDSILAGPGEIVFRDRYWWE